MEQSPSGTHGSWAGLEIPIILWESFLQQPATYPCPDSGDSSEYLWSSLFLSVLLDYIDLC